MFRLNIKNENYVFVYKSVDGTKITLNNASRPIISYGLDLCGVLNIQFHIQYYSCPIFNFNSNFKSLFNITI